MKGTEIHGRGAVKGTGVHKGGLQRTGMQGRGVVNGTGVNRMEAVKGTEM